MKVFILFSINFLLCAKLIDKVLREISFYLPHVLISLKVVLSYRFLFIYDSCVSSISIWVQLLAQNHLKAYDNGSRELWNSDLFVFDVIFFKVQKWGWKCLMLSNSCEFEKNFSLNSYPVNHVLRVCGCWG